METYPSSGSLIETGINSSLSTQITIKVGPTTIGAIQSATIDQNREIAVHEEIGTDGVIDSHPKNAARVAMQVERIIFDQLRLTEAFARGFINLQAQRIPFDVQIIDKSEQFLPANFIQGGGKSSSSLLGASTSVRGVANFADQINGGTNKDKEIRDAMDKMVLVHTLHSCWFSVYSPTWSANNYIISEKATIKAEKITSHRGGLSAVNGGLRGISFDYDDIERNTDVHGRPGRFDPSSINADEAFSIFSR